MLMSHSSLLNHTARHPQRKARAWYALGLSLRYELYMPKYCKLGKNFDAGPAGSMP